MTVFVLAAPLVQAAPTGGKGGGMSGGAKIGRTLGNGGVFRAPAFRNNHPGATAPSRHGNSKGSTNPHYNYNIFMKDKQTGVVRIHKSGISGGRLGKNGKPYRTNSQVDRLNAPSKNPSAKNYQYLGRIDRQTTNRVDALGHEQHRVNQY